MFLFVWIEDNVHGLTAMTVPITMDTAADKSAYNFQADSMRREGAEVSGISLKALSMRRTLEDLINEL